MHCLYLTCERTHVKIKRHWKSTLSRSFVTDIFNQCFKWYGFHFHDHNRPKQIIIYLFIIIIIIDINIIITSTIIIIVVIIITVIMKKDLVPFKLFWCLVTTYWTQK